MTILSWDKPKLEEDYATWASRHVADSAPPGVYIPNMSKEDRRKWKAKLVGKRSGDLTVEIRRECGSLVAIKVGTVRQGKTILVDYDIAISANGPIWLTLVEWDEMQQAIEEAKTELASHGFSLLADKESE